MRISKDDPYEIRLQVARELVALLDEGTAGDIPVHVFDQIMSASRDMGEYASHVAEALGKTVEPAVPSEVAARVMATAVEIDRWCPHLKEQMLQPMIWFLQSHEAVCYECLKALRVSPEPPDEGDRCDWCGSHGVEWFWSTKIIAGFIMVVGEACDDCRMGLVGSLDPTP